MTVQRDMFDGDPFAPEPIPTAPDPVARVDEPAPAGGDHDGNAVALAPLAVPCGFRNRRNEPCRRLAERPILMNGQPFVHRGHQLLQCPRSCWLDDDSAVEPDIADRIGEDIRFATEPDIQTDPHGEDPDAHRDPDDPGIQEMPDYDAGDDGGEYEWD